MSNSKDLSFSLGESWVMPFDMNDADGNVLTGTGSTPEWLLQDYETRETIILATVGNGRIVWTDQAAGLGTITISPAVQNASACAEKPGTYRYRFDVTLADSTVSDQGVGDFIITQRGEIADDDEEEGGGGGGGGGGSTSSGGNFLSLGTITGARSLSDADSGYLLLYAGDADVNVTVPSTLTAGFHCGIMPTGDGDVVLVDGSGMVNETVYDRTGAQYGTLTVVVFATGHYAVGGAAL